MDETEVKNESGTDVADLIKVSTQKDAKTQAQTEQKRKRKQRAQPSSKNLLVEPTDKALYRVKFEYGGQLPEELSGLFTTSAHAQRAIDRYLSKRGR